ncbi:MAG: TIGR03084 family protein [Rickettsiales bacterium]|nr:TIGR03084 family protein [Rickettsiales bacterium]OUV79149.1 MAG: TIGR03084 family protein [Rickettsiales bacterium TMED131]
MLKQADDFYEESNCLHKILSELSEKELKTKSQFKNWSFNDIIRHLHVWNHASFQSLLGDKEWSTYLKKLKTFFKQGKKLQDFEKYFTKNIKGRDLISLWKTEFKKVADSFKKENPRRRVKWVGPEMSTISSISARHMETWAHGQAIYDSLGIVRKNQDRILNIVIIGNNTFSWTYKVNNRKTPISTPYLKLKSPSGKIWKFNDPKSHNKIEGLAEEFCQVVTQVRNIKDVNLKLSGSIANEWMTIAQCFAGKASTPPNPGTRNIIINK